MPKPDNNDPIDKAINAMNNPKLRQQYLSELGINNSKNGCTYIKHYSNKQRSKKAETLQKKATSNQQTQESTDAANSNPQESRKTIESVTSPRR